MMIFSVNTTNKVASLCGLGDNVDALNRLLQVSSSEVVVVPDALAAAALALQVVRRGRNGRRA
jgi:hypothetical protein